MDRIIPETLAVWSSKVRTVVDYDKQSGRFLIPSRGTNSDVPLWPSGAGFGVLVLAVVASWQIRSAFTVGLVAFLAVILFALVEIDLSSLRNRSSDQSGLDSERLVQDLESAAMALAAVKASSSSSAAHHTSDMAETTDEAVSAEEEGRQKRAQLEKLINAAATLGWKRAYLGSAQPPDLVVHWAQDGAPNIHDRPDRLGTEFTQVGKRAAKSPPTGDGPSYRE